MKYSHRNKGPSVDKINCEQCQYWGSELQLPTLDFEDVLKDDEHAYMWLSNLKKVGIVRLTGASDKRGEILKLGKRIGFLYLTFYGRKLYHGTEFVRHTWQVQDKLDANNVAYTTGKLSFHTDYPALHHPPGVQLLHCIKQTVTGGDSEIVDGFNVCRKLKEKNPQAFQILSSTFVDFTDIGVDYCDFSVQSKHKIIELDDKGQVVRINFNNATRDTIFDVPIEKVQPFYAALKEFVDLMNCKEFKLTFKMNPGLDWGYYTCLIPLNFKRTAQLRKPAGLRGLTVDALTQIASLCMGPFLQGQLCRDAQAPPEGLSEAGPAQGQALHLPPQWGAFSICSTKPSPAMGPAEPSSPLFTSASSSTHPGQACCVLHGKPLFLDVSQLCSSAHYSQSTGTPSTLVSMPKSQVQEKREFEKVLRIASLIGQAS
ncbi:gamma-butyrobetaine dioxygenase [Camelus ferus]|nr:gamma-butyrobetaine dioxygenase [Camelus ferus]